MITTINRPKPNSADHLNSLAILRMALAHLEAERETCYTNAVARAISEINMSGSTNDFQVHSQLAFTIGELFLAAE